MTLSVFIMLSSSIILASLLLAVHLINKFSKRAIISEDNSNTSEQLFLEFRENSHQVLWRMDLSTHQITTLSPFAEQMFGRSVAFINQDPNNWLSFVTPDDKPKLMAAIESVQQGTAVSNVEVKILRADGIVAVLSSELFPSRDLNQKIIAVLGITSDVTAQYYLALHKQLQAELRKNLNHFQDMKLLSQHTLKSLCCALGYDIGELWIVDQKENRLNFFAEWSRDELEVTFNHDILLMNSKKTKNNFQVICLDTNTIQYSTLATYLLHVTAEINGSTLHLKEIVGVPIILSDKKIGVMCFYNRQILNRDNDSDKLLLEFAEEFGKAIQNNLLMNEVKYTTDYDVLTGLYNQSSFINKINELIKQKAKPTILQLRINNLQLINYTLGFDVGNKILQDLSKKISQFSLSYGVSSAVIDMVAITEPGIFGFVSHEFTDKANIIDFVDKLLAIIKKPLTEQEPELFLTASIGISRYPENGSTAYKLLSSAGFALSESLKEGSNQFQFATEEMLSITSHSIEIEQAVHRALKNNEFELYYQPKVSLTTGKITGVEALIRWHDLNNIIRLPDYFIPVCQQSNLINSVNDWVLAAAIRDIVRSEHPMRTSINLLANQFSGTYNLLEKLQQLTSASNLDYNYLELEVTETVLMANKTRTAEIIPQLKQLGIRIALDDFGTGYNSFAYLISFTPDVIKIDKSFLEGVPGDMSNIKIINAIISVSHSLNLTVIAEGVENAAQVKFLMNAGCDEIQGYYFSKAVPFAKMQQLIKQDARLTFPQ